MSDLVIRNAKVFYQGDFFEGGVEVDNGIIIRISKDPLLPEGEITIDAKGMIVFPGGVDPHVHWRVPGMTHKEDYNTGSEAAAAGGVTTILDMPNTNPPTTTVQRLEEKIDIIKKRYMPCVDYGFHFQAARDNADELRKLARECKDKIASAKIFTAGHETTPTTIPDHESLESIFSVLSEVGLPVSVHAEKQDMIKALEAKYKTAGMKKFSAWCDARNEETTIESVREILGLAEKYGTKTHICHASTGTEVDLILRARQKGVPVTCDVTWYNLLLNRNDAEKYGAFGKVSPALKSEQERKKLFNHVIRGNVDFLITEHTPHTLEEKAGGVWEAPAGMPGLDTYLPVLITMGMKQGLTYGHIAKLYAENPAKYYGLKGKGKIEEGYYADLVLFDPNKEWAVKNEDMKTKCRWSLLEGKVLKGRPEKTFVRGVLVYDGGNILARPGKWVYELNRERKF